MKNFETNNNTMDKKFENRNESDVEVLEREPETVDSGELQKKVTEDLSFAKTKVEGAISDIQKMTGSVENSSGVEKIKQLKTDMFEDLISRVKAKMSQAKEGSEMYKRLYMVLTSFKNGQEKGGNPITLVENMRMTYGIDIAGDIADELVSEKALKKGLMDFISGGKFRNDAMAKYAGRFQSEGVSDEDIEAMVKSGSKMSAAYGEKGL